MLYRLAAVVVLLAGCQDDISTRFPPGLEPFDDGDKPLELDATPSDEELRSSSDDSDIVKVYGRGFVFRPFADVWAATQDPEVLVAVCETSSHSVMANNEPDYELSFLVHYFVDDVLDVEWDDQWRGDIVVGDAGAEHAMVKHQKVQGSDFISTSEGTIEILATPDPAVTELRFVEHLDAVSATTGDVLSGMQHTFDALKAVSHGESIPRCP